MLLIDGIHHHPKRPREVARARRLRLRKGLSAIGDLGDEGDPVLAWSPSDVQALADTVAREVDSIGRAVTAAWANGKLTSAQRAPWKKFYDEFAKFNRGRSWLGSVFVALSGVVSTLKKYRQQAREWAQRLAAAGIKTDIPIPPPKPPGAEDEWKTYLKWGLIVGGLVAVASVAAPAVRALSGGVQAFRRAA